MTCSDGSSAAVAIVVAKKVADSTVNIPKVTEKFTPGHLYLIGELLVANRCQCRFLPEDRKGSCF